MRSSGSMSSPRGFDSVERVRTCWVTGLQGPRVAAAGGTNGARRTSLYAPVKQTPPAPTNGTLDDHVEVCYQCRAGLRGRKQRRLFEAGESSTDLGEESI